MGEAILLRDRDASEMLGISRSHFRHQVAQGVFPLPIKLGANSRWRRDEILKALENLEAQPIKTINE
jgi:predicted DNA-binding transcriptional regulator AlpA